MASENVRNFLNTTSCFMYVAKFICKPQYFVLILGIYVPKIVVYRCINLILL